MKNLDFEWLTDEFVVYCRSTQLREKTMKSYEQTLRLFERWCYEQMNITTVDKVTESVIRHYTLPSHGMPAAEQGRPGCLDGFYTKTPGSFAEPGADFLESSLTWGCQVFSEGTLQPVWGLQLPSVQISDPDHS